LPHLFVYGTLRRGCDNEFARMLEEHGQFIGSARVSGQLYDFGLYPGARPANGSVTGEIFQIDESLLAKLDPYEGPEFERAVAPTSLDIHCWIYWYAGPAEGRLIESGDWLHP
jgi:gamma-glutamylcyclotransferase (GGCT)/AIG2-like uncharacterized protein YtfP